MSKPKLCPPPESGGLPEEVADAQHELSSASNPAVGPNSSATGSDDRALSLKLLAQAGQTLPGATKDVAGSAKATMAQRQVISPSKA